VSEKFQHENEMHINSFPMLLLLLDKTKFTALLQHMCSSSIIIIMMQTTAAATSQVFQVKCGRRFAKDNLRIRKWQTRRWFLQLKRKQKESITVMLTNHFLNSDLRRNKHTFHFMNFCHIAGPHCCLLLLISLKRRHSVERPLRVSERERGRDRVH